MAYKLTYFDARSIGEAIRQVPELPLCSVQIFALAEQPFEDVRIAIEDWPKLRPSIPCGQLPILEVEGVVLTQSAAIGRFVARRFGLAGKTDIEQAQVDAVVDHFKDYYAAINDWFYTAAGLIKAGVVDELYAAKYEPARDKLYPILVDLLRRSTSGFLIGDSPTWADLLVADHLRTIRSLKPGALTAYPELLKLQGEVEALPQIRRWLETRPSSAF